MPWVKALSATQELRRCIRDLVALSMLPAIWKNYDPRQIAESMASALVSMIESEFVHISLPGGPDEPEVEVMRSGSGIVQDYKNAARIALQEWNARGRLEVITVATRFSDHGLRLACAPIGLEGNAVLVAGSQLSNFPTESQRLLLGIAANDVSIALQRWHTEKEERRFTELVESSSDFIGFAGLDGVPKYINAAGLRLLGIDGMAQASRFQMLDFLMPEERKHARDELWPIVMRAGRWVGELNFRHFQTGAAIPFLVDWFRVDDPRTGRPMNIATVSRDLTAQKSHEAELRHLNATLEGRVADRTGELAAANHKLRSEIVERERTNAHVHELQLELFHAARVSAVGQLAAALAHEINQPLTAAVNSINAAKRLLARNGNGTPLSLAEALNDASKQAIRAGQIIHRSREFIRRGKTDKSVEDVAALIQEAGTLALIGSDAAGVNIAFRFDKDVSGVFVDRVQVQQVLTNLMRNAVEAMAGKERRELVISAALLDKDNVEIAVADSGAGLSPEVRDRVFDPFISTKRHGMGLGLSICRTIVEAHGGKLRCESNAGGGTVFRFTIPAASTTGGDNAN